MREQEEYFKNDVELLCKVDKISIQIIREWLKKQPHLPKISDKQLVIFLNCCKNNLERTKKKIESYYTMRTNSPEIFAHRTVKELEKTFDTYYIYKLPVTPNECRVGFSRLRDFESNNFNILDTIRLLLAMLDMSINEDPLALEWRFVIDMAGFSMGHLTKLMDLKLMKKCLTYIQFGQPLRLIGIHLINAPPLASQLMMFLKPMMHRDLYSSIFVYSHNDMKNFYKIIPQEFLSSDLGGKSLSLEELKEQTSETLQKYEKWFENDNKYGRVDETKRIDKNQYDSDEYGIEGSFKKLEFD
ncbi:retinaldehyde-binding protein 1-like [Daktulosphaira vitifoliae]|uniref:retinaldehyde-binding protein 1-like n=1 Tax=Daktulosphaira vitifoliae TaxID=58002 RepID=UPI0021A9BE1A|nr:retinaldehyde-binding protein 1-like [Daktulosphaira vitifoliae]XP_050535191.1 retinaldehyde-binding protein 1-like [Daktulosphaira vitifoliae]